MNGWLLPRRTTTHRHIYGRTAPQPVPKNLRARPTKNLSAVERSSSKTTTTICPCPSPHGHPQKQQPKTTNRRMGTKGTTIPSRCHGCIGWKNKRKTCRIRRDQLPCTSIYTTRRIHAKRKGRRRTPPKRHKGSGMLHMP